MKCISPPFNTVNVLAVTSFAFWRTNFFRVGVVYTKAILVSNTLEFNENECSFGIIKTSVKIRINL
jgi:hypothetical protein